MAIIPVDEKVFMVSNSTNTTYSGSASLKAMNEWYTMQDVIDSVPASPAGLNMALPQVSNASLAFSNNVIASTTSSVPQNTNTLYLSIFNPANDLTISTISIQVTTAVAASLSKILVYNSVDGRPSGKLIESVDLDCSTTGTKTYLVAYTFEAGKTYWIGAQSSATQSLRAWAMANLAPLGVSTDGAVSFGALTTSAYVFGTALPETPAMSISTGGTVPLIIMK